MPKFTLYYGLKGDRYIPNADKMPFYGQAFNGCGTASLAMVMTYLGVTRTPDQIDAAIRSPNFFTFPKEIISYARANGLQAEGYNNGSWEELKSQIDLGHPCICLINADYSIVDPPNCYFSDSVGLHYIVIVGYGWDRETFQPFLIFHDPYACDDPAKGQKGVDIDAPLATFDYMWNTIPYWRFNTTGFHNYFMAFGTRGTYLPAGREKGDEGAATLVQGIGDASNGCRKHKYYEVLGWVVQIIVGALGFLPQYFAQELRKVGDAIPGLQILVWPVSAIFDGIGAALGDIGSGIGNALSDIGDAFASLFTGDIGGFFEDIGNAILDFLQGLADAIIAVLTAIVDFFESIFEAISNWFTGSNNGGSVNLMFFTNGNWQPKKTLNERSGEQPSLSLSSAGMFLGWTGVSRDHHLNAYTFQPGCSPVKANFEEAYDAGPALAFDGCALSVAWQGNDGQLHLIPELVGDYYATKLTLPGKPATDSSPGLAATPATGLAFGRLFLSFVGLDGHINIFSAADRGRGQWAPVIAALNDTTFFSGTPALAYGNGKLFLSWVGTDQARSLNIISFNAAADGSLSIIKRVTLNEQSNPGTGPSIACDGGALVLAWISPDKQVNVMRGKTDLTFEAKQSFESSRLDCGPAVATAGEGGVIVVSWIGRS